MNWKTRDRDESFAGDKTVESNLSRTLEFNEDAGASRPLWMAAGLVVTILLWMGSGFVYPSEVEGPVAKREEPAPISVAVTQSRAESVAQIFRAEGQALADRDTMLLAETSGSIVDVAVSKGEEVAGGDVIARFDPASNQAEARRTAQELARAQREFDNAQSLLEQGVATTDRMVQARATLSAARAQVTAVEQAAEALTITAPFSGRVETLDINEGEFVAAGTSVGRIVDITPLTVAIQVSQQSLMRLSRDQKATVRFITGEERTGVVSYIGSAASPETRTFLTEIEVPNEDGMVPAGVSAEVVIATNEVTAHFLPSSIISLDSKGTPGVKTVNAQNKVEFYPIEVVRAQIDGVWVTGLPETADVITVGQGYVNEGETVAPRSGEQGS